MFHREHTFFVHLNGIFIFTLLYVYVHDDVVVDDDDDDANHHRCQHHQINHIFSSSRTPPMNTLNAIIVFLVHIMVAYGLPEGSYEILPTLPYGMETSETLPMDVMQLAPPPLTPSRGSFSDTPTSVKRLMYARGRLPKSAQSPPDQADDSIPEVPVPPSEEPAATLETPAPETPADMDMGEEQDW